MPEKIKFPEYWLYWTYTRPQLLKPVLQTAAGQRLRILQPGSRNEDNGPDFRQALLEVAGVRCRGDLEFHLSPEDWFRHGHEQDERYRQVVLHVLWDAPAGIPAGLADRFPHLLLRENLRVDESEWLATMRRLEEEGGATAPPERPAASLSPERLGRLAHQRLARKIDRVAHWHRYFPLEEVLYITLAEALGYSKNKFPFRQLLWECPPSHLSRALPVPNSPPLLWAYLAYRGGLLNHLLQGAAEGPAVLQRGIRHFRERGYYPLLALSDWNFSRLRPPNNPYLRLVALAQLLHREAASPLFSRLLRIAMARRSLAETLPAWLAELRLPLDAALAEMIQELLKFDPLPHYIMGLSRARQFVVNGLLPVLLVWARGSGNAGFRSYLEGLYEAFPGAEERSVVETQAHYIADQALAERLRRSAFLQQGMLEFVSNRLIR